MNGDPVSIKANFTLNEISLLPDGGGGVGHHMSSD